MKYLGKITDQKDLVTKEYVDGSDALKANNSEVVHNVGAETVAGTKTFSTRPILITSSSILPAGYQQVDYLQSSGTQRINTGIIPTATLSYEIRTAYLRTGFVFGARVSNSSKITSLNFDAQNPVALMARIGSNSAGMISTTTLTVNHVYNVKICNGASAIYNETTKTLLASNSAEYGTNFATNLPLYLFTINNNGSAGPSNYSINRIYGFIVKDNGFLIKNYVPCYRISDNVAGMYETVSGTFCTNEGTGTFTVGPTTVINSNFAVAADLDLKVNITDLAEVAISGDYDDLSNKPTSLSQFTDNLGSSPIHTHSQYLTSHQDISGKEDQSNKTTTISSSSTDTQYPSAKAIYDYIDENSMPRINVTSSQFIDGSHIQLTDAQWNTIFGKEHRNIVYIDFDEIPGYEQYYCIIESNMDEYEYYQVRGTSYAIKLDYFTFDSSTKIVTLSHIESSTNNDDLTIGSMVKFYNDQFHKAIAGTDYEDPSNKILVWTDTSKVDDNHYPSALLTKNSLDGKVDVVSGKGLSQNDYTDAEKSLVHGANQAKGYTNYQTLITELNADDGTTYKTGQTFYIQTLNVPDVWVYSIESTSSTYTYTTDAAFVTAMSAGAVQVGKYKIAMLETLKQDLTNYALDANVVHKTGAETVAGNKTFSGTNTHTGATTIKNALKVQYGNPNGCMVIGADVSGTTLTNGTRTLGRLSFPYQADKSVNCSFVSLDTQNGNGAEFGGRQGDSTTGSPDYISFTTATNQTDIATKNNKTLVAQFVKDKVQFFPNGGTSVTPSKSGLTGKWEFYNGCTFKNNGYTYTLPNKTGTIATTADIPSVSGKENTSNKVSTWSATTDNTHYPTEKLVKDSLDTKANSSELANKMDKANPTGTGSFSLNRTVNTTIGDYSIAAGKTTEASGEGSVALGYETTASGECSFAEGDCTVANGLASHVEGESSEAHGNFSHAQNNWTIANGDNQTTLGKFNVADSTSAIIVGNGTQDGRRSNAMKMDWNGNVDLAGKINGVAIKHLTATEYPNEVNFWELNNGQGLDSGIYVIEDDVAINMDTSGSPFSTGVLMVGNDRTNGTYSYTFCGFDDAWAFTPMFGSALLEDGTENTPLSYMQSKNNMTANISSSSTHNTYPTSKAVYDAIQAALIVDTEAAIQ